jgi:hypothetical protein
MNGKFKYPKCSIGRVTENDIPGLEKELRFLKEWTNTTNIVFEYCLLNICMFDKQIVEMQSSYAKFPKEKRRKDRILKTIQKTGELWPVYIEAKDCHHFIIEGRHRIVAFKEAGITRIPCVKLHYK